MDAAPRFHYSDLFAGPLLAATRARSPGADPLPFLSAPPALEAVALVLQTLQGTRIGDLFAGGQHRQVPDPHIHPDCARVLIGGGQLASDCARKGDIPATGRASDGGRQNAAGATLEVAGELAGRFVGLDGPEPRELDMFAVR